MSSKASKPERLRRLCTSAGIVAALAIDQRKSLRRMIAEAGGGPAESVSDAQLSEFKAAVVAALTPEASAVLLDPDYGLDARSARAGSCGLLLAYEMDGFENPRPHRMLALAEQLSVKRIKELGADGVKILLTYSPFDDPKFNDAKHALIERIGAECEAEELPFFLEPVGYDPGGLDLRSAEYAAQKPEIVTRMMAEFSKDRYRVDVLKVEFPVVANYIGQVYSREQALERFRRADGVAGRPYIYLSAGISIDLFIHSLELAGESGARYSGVLCGRATWQDGAKEYASGGKSALDRWLRTGGIENMRRLNAALASATAIAPARQTSTAISLGT